MAVCGPTTWLPFVRQQQALSIMAQLALVSVFLLVLPWGTCDQPLQAGKGVWSYRLFPERLGSPMTHL